MHLAQERFLLGERAAQLLLDLLAAADVARHPHAALWTSGAVVEVAWRADDGHRHAAARDRLGFARAVGATDHLADVAPHQLDLAPSELLDRRPVHGLHAASHVGGDEDLAHGADDVVHVGLGHRRGLEALSHGVERQGECPELVGGAVRHADREVAGPETVGRVAEPLDRTRDRAGGEEPEEHGQRQCEHGDQHVLAIGLGE